MKPCQGSHSRLRWAFRPSQCQCCCTISGDTPAKNCALLPRQKSVILHPWTEHGLIPTSFWLSWVGCYRGSENGHPGRRMRHTVLWGWSWHSRISPKPCVHALWWNTAHQHSTYWAVTIQSGLSSNPALLPSKLKVVCLLKEERGLNM